MPILFVAAVDFELDVARAVWAGQPARFLCTGMGAVSTVRALETAIADGGFDRVVDLGLAGSYREDLPIGTVVHVLREQYGERPGELLLQNAPWPELDFLPDATGNTVQQLDDRYRRVTADVESMEGAAFFETCLRHGLPFAELRAVSNAVGERDHARWDIALALRNLEAALQTLRFRVKPGMT